MSVLLLIALLLSESFGYDELNACEYIVKLSNNVTRGLDLTPLKNLTIIMPQEPENAYWLKFTPCSNAVSESCYPSSMVMAAQMMGNNDPNGVGILALWDNKTTQPTFSQTSGGSDNFTFHYPPMGNTCHQGCNAGRQYCVNYICDPNSDPYDKTQSRFYETARINNLCHYHLDLYTKYACPVTLEPTKSPTKSPTSPTKPPTKSPTKAPIKAPTIIDLSVTFGLEKEAYAEPDPDEANYFQTSLCFIGVNYRKQAVLQAYLPNNVDWNTTAKPLVVIQVSICKNDFSQNCVIATNYQWGIQIKAVPNISWTINNESEYFIRSMGWNQPAKFSMELSFTNTTNIFSYPWTTDAPFMVPTMTKQPNPLSQYWRSTAVYTVDDDGHKRFSLGYCHQGPTVKGINVALSALPQTTDYSLVQQWACPQTVPIEQCSNSNSVSVGWHNFRIAAFNLLTCIDDDNKSTENGIFIVVQGDGANRDGINTFYLAASQYGS